LIKIVRLVSPIMAGKLSLRSQLSSLVFEHRQIIWVYFVFN